MRKLVVTGRVRRWTISRYGAPAPADESPGGPVPALSVDTAPVGAPTPAPPPPPAYPDPIHLPVAPHGDPLAARLLADAYRTLAERLDRTASDVQAISADLAGRWHGHGATALAVPSDTVHANLRTLAQSYRAAADHLTDYADALHKAQHHHGWSLGKFIAIGAVVTITAVAVVVTVGAAAPVGTLAAAEVGEAILGAEAAAAGATVAETAATSGLALTAESMSGLRTLTALALPHLTQGAISTGIDVGVHLVTGHAVSADDLKDSFLAGTVSSATTSVTRSALRSSEVYAGAGTVRRAAMDTTALTTTLTADSALQQYAGTGHINPTALTEAAVLIAVTGGASTLRHPLDGTGSVVRTAPSGQTLAELERNGVDLSRHEGPYPLGHTDSKHVGKTVDELKARLLTDRHITAASSFTDRATAEAAITRVLKACPAAVLRVATNPGDHAEFKVRLARPIGFVVRRDDSVVSSSVIVIKIANIQGKVIVRTAFVGRP